MHEMSLIETLVFHVQIYFGVLEHIQRNMSCDFSAFVWIFDNKQ